MMTARPSVTEHLGIVNAEQFHELKFQKERSENCLGVAWKQRLGRRGKAVVAYE